jgi:cytochrome bd-type quinol oxidase subunit 2
LYNVTLILHNSFGGLTLLLTLVAAVILLATARTTSRGASLALRGSLISASLQFVFGLALVVIGFAMGRSGEITSYWLHYLLGFVAVGVLSAVAARGRRAADQDARRYGSLLLGVFLLVLVTFLVGQFRYTPF